MNYLDIVRQQLRADEAVRADAYDDATGKRVRAPVGNLTIGVGHDLDAKPLSDAAIAFILEEDIADAYDDARVVVGSGIFDSLTDARKAVLCNLAFNLGRERLAGFHLMLAALRAGDWGSAAHEIVASHLAPARARRLAAQMEGDTA